MNKFQVFHIVLKSIQVFGWLGARICFFDKEHTQSIDTQC